MNRHLQRRMSMSRRILNAAARQQRRPEMPKTTPAAPAFNLKKAVAKTQPQPEPEIMAPLKGGMADASTQAAEVQQLAAQMVPEVNALKVKTPEDFLVADELLGRIKKAQKFWTSIWVRIEEKTVRPIRAGLEELYQLNRDVARPLDTLERRVKDAMGAYKIEEKRLADEAERLKREEAERLQREADAKAAAAAAAKTPQLRGRLEAQAERLNEKAQEVAEQPAQEAVKGSFSGTRLIPTYVINDMTTFLVAIAEGRIPEEAILLNTTYINRRFKVEPEVVASWPGVEVKDVPLIVGR